MNQVGSLRSHELAEQWAARASGAGWAFPSDWHVAAVDAVCEAIADCAEVWPAAERLGQSRSAAGVSLGEALADIDALCAIVPSRLTSTLRRAVSLGWADRVVAAPAAVSDPLTGLCTADYLQTRLGEVYRAAEVGGSDVGERRALVVVRLDLLGRTGWHRVLPMILTADSMRCVFDGGQSLAQLGEGVAVVLTERDEMLARRARLLSSMISTQVGRDPQAAIPDPQVWVESLPPRYGAALDLVRALGR